VIQWSFSKTPLTIGDFTQVEEKLGIQLPTLYKKIQYKHHGARPSKRKFITVTGKERVIKTFLPLSDEYKINPSNVKQWLQLPNSIYPFANTPSGDYLCLEYFDDKEPSVVLYHHEIDGFEFISEDFQAFLASLH
jgi:hypothetical protein